MWYYELHCEHTELSEHVKPTSGVVVFCKACKRYQAVRAVIGTDAEVIMWEEDTDEHEIC